MNQSVFEKTPNTAFAPPEITKSLSSIGMILLFATAIGYLFHIFTAAEAGGLICVGALAYYSRSVGRVALWFQEVTFREFISLVPNPASVQVIAVLGNTTCLGFASVFFFGENFVAGTGFMVVSLFLIIIDSQCDKYTSEKNKG